MTRSSCFEVAALREQIYAPLPHARVALDYFTLYEIANWQGDARTALPARERARWHLERTAAPDDRRLEDLHVAAAITSNQTADLAEGMIGFSVDDGGDWEAPPGRRRRRTPVESGRQYFGGIPGASPGELGRLSRLATARRRGAAHIRNAVRSATCRMPVHSAMTDARYG